VAVAHQLDEGVYDVTQWTCVGVRSGGEYAVDYPGTGRLYTTSQDVERIDGRIIAGPDAQMELDIPPASTRSVLSRRRVEALPLGMHVELATFDDRGLASLTIGVGGDFPAEPLMLLVAHTNQIFQLHQIGNVLTLVPSSRRPLASFLTEHLQVGRIIGLGAGLTGNRSPDTSETETDVYENAMRTLIGNSYGLGDRVDLIKLQRPDNLLRVFVYAKQPQALQMEGDSFLDQQGYVLYCVDLPAQGGRMTPADAQTDAPDDLP
jgi:hypothetical protein